MKTDRPYARIIVTKKGARWLETGHPWVYGTDVSGAMGSGGEGIPFSGMAGAPFPEDRLPNGSVVDVCAENG
ncbi:MAG: hypothetical protein J6U26_00650, partial [Lachnospiraceae bacterium]|nr:hypothetical protein [Lachnospiraceae bacterium]